MKKVLLTFSLLALIAAGSFAQSVRYLDEIFTDAQIQVDTGVTYGQNYEFFTGFQQLQPLKMDVYRPIGDTATHRPIVLLSHNGSFLPEALTHALIGLCFSGRKDSSTVEMCKRFAKRGYVAVSFDYRLGWSATSSDQITRTKTIIQAVYRAMQDAKTLVRYLKNDFATNANSYGIDTGKIVIGGTNSGAYVALAAGNLNNPTELNSIKFVDVNGPFIKQDTIGDFDGFGGFQNHDNYPGISSRFQCVLSLGGAVGDTSWIEPGEVPVLAFHGVNESSTKYNTGIVNTSTGQPVIEVSGPGDFMPYVDAKGNNNAFKPNNFGQGPPNRDGLGQQTSPIEGLYPFYGRKFEPWNWYDTTCYNNSAAMLNLNPGSSRTSGNLYIDTIMGYSLPRLYRLFIDHSYGTTGINEIAKQIEMNLYPNPASTELFVSISNFEKPISTIQLFDLTGRLVKEITNVNMNQKHVEIGDLNNGMYHLTLKLTDGLTATKNVVVAR